MRVSEDQLVAHVAAHAGGPEDAHRVTAAVLSWISGGLSPAVRELIADELPASFARIVRAGTGRPLILRGHHYELAASVCRVLAEELSGEACAVLGPALPPVLARLFVEPAPERREPPSVIRTWAEMHVRARPAH